MSERQDGHAVTPISDDALLRFPDFIQAVRARLETGRNVYGDKSFLQPPQETLEELANEALDLAGWGFVLWARIRQRI